MRGSSSLLSLNIMTSFLVIVATVYRRPHLLSCGSLTSCSPSKRVEWFGAKLIEYAPRTPPLQQCQHLHKHMHSKTTEDSVKRALDFVTSTVQISAAFFPHEEKSEYRQSHRIFHSLFLLYAQGEQEEKKRQHAREKRRSFRLYIYIYIALKTLIPMYATRSFTWCLPQASPSFHHLSSMNCSF